MSTAMSICDLTGGRVILPTSQLHKAGRFGAWNTYAAHCQQRKETSHVDLP